MSGRCGRNGEQSQTIIFMNDELTSFHKSTASRQPRMEEKIQKYLELYHCEYALKQRGCLRETLLATFNRGEESETTGLPNCCDHCRRENEELSRNKVKGI